MRSLVPLAVTVLTLTASCDADDAVTPAAVASVAATAAASAAVEPPRIDLAMAAVPATSSGHTNCNDITGYLNDPDPAGRIVRAEPSPDARELGRLLPPLKGGAFDPLPASFEILGSQDGWLEIEGAGYDEFLAGKPAAKMFTGRGWIWGGEVSVGLQSETGFAQPSHKSAVLVSLGTGGSFDGGAHIQVAGCTRRWVLVEIDGNTATPAPTFRPEAVVRQKPLRLRSWVAGVCNITETTCDGVNGNRAETSHLDRDPNKG